MRGSNSGTKAFGAANKIRASAGSPSSGRGVKYSPSGHSLYKDEEDYEVEDLKIDSDDDDEESRSPVKPLGKASKKEIMAALQQEAAEAEMILPKPKHTCWGYIIDLLTLLPWAIILTLSWFINHWQRLWRPLNRLIYAINDRLDLSAPVILGPINWLYDTTSLVLHVVDVAIKFGLLKVLYDNGHYGKALLIVGFYLFSHWTMAVIMFRELDYRGPSLATGRDVFKFLARMADVLFFDIQLVACMVHGNRMIEGMTQLLLKGYEESRVAVHCLLHSIPTIIIVGLSYSGPIKYDIHEIKQVDIYSYQDQVYTALVISILNCLDKIMRMSLMDPWMHADMDGFPLLYVRSDAARLPWSITWDWLFRCRVHLEQNEGRLVLKDLYALYTTRIKDKVRQLCDTHKAYLLRRAIHTFNNTDASISNSRLHSKLVNASSIKALVAAEIQPGKQLCRMLADLMKQASGFNTLVLANNNLDDTSIIDVLMALKCNSKLQLQFLDLSGNAIFGPGAKVVAEMLQDNRSLFYLKLADNQIRDDGARALAEALKANIGLAHLDLSNCNIGADGGGYIGAALKGNQVLSVLNLSGTRVGNTGAEAVARALRHNTHLRELCLSGTTVDDKGAAAIAAALTLNRGLERLHLARTNIGDAGAKALCDALQSNHSLNYIDVSGNELMDKSWQKLLVNMMKGKGSTQQQARM